MQVVKSSTNQSKARRIVSVVRSLVAFTNRNNSDLMQKIEPQSAEAQSVDLIADNVEKLKAMFPELITEGADGVEVNVDVLKQLVGSVCTDASEKYGLNWHGKRAARQIALTPSTGTLLPCPEDSVDWDTTQNLMIEGDNLEVLKLLQKSYSGKVKLIYIDPPYNTGKDFVYKDNFKDNIKNYLELTGQVEGGSKISSNTESSGRFHTDWLNMMYPRLKLARNLLSEDGLMCISIDDNEVATLKHLMAETWGAENSLVPLIWSLPRGINAGHISRAHEYIIVHAKNKESLDHFRREGDFEGSIDRCNKKIDIRHPESTITFPAGMRYEGPDKSFCGVIPGNERVTVYGTMQFRNGRLIQSVSLAAGWTVKTMILDWLAGKEVFDTKGQKISEFFFKENGKLYSRKEAGLQTLKSILKDVPDTHVARKEIEKLFGTDEIFNYPKPSGLIQKLISICTKNQDLVFDFFAGSGTTGHAVMAQNAIDSGNRRYILVQLPEPLDPENKDQKTAADYCDQIGKPRTIAELTKERLRRAGANIKAENPMFAGDTGFRVFKLNTSNIQPWNPDSSNLEQTLLDHANHIVAGRTENDILYEVLLKLGLDLCVPIEQRIIADKTVHAIGNGALIACLAEQITLANIETLGSGIVNWHKEMNPVGDTTCIFRDSAFQDDVVKANLTAILFQYGIKNVRSL